MDLSIPIVICEKREEIRVLIRDMLTKHGFFHLIEANTSEEVLHITSIDKKKFILIHKDLLDESIKTVLSQRNNFIIISPVEEGATLELASRYGVGHIISFPYSSKGLAERIINMLSQ